MHVLARNGRIAGRLAYPGQLFFQYSPVGIFQHADAAICRARYHRPNWRFDPRHVNAISAFRLPRRKSEHALEGRTKSTMRFEPALEDDVVDLRAPANFRECLAQTARPHVRLKRHPALRLKVPTDPRRLKTQLAEVIISPAAPWILFDPIQQRAQPIWRRAGRFHWLAALAGAVSGNQRLARRIEELHILRQRLARRARRDAEDAGSSNRRVKQAVVRAV